jgi:hypothetical protein
MSMDQCRSCKERDDCSATNMQTQWHVAAAAEALAAVQFVRHGWDVSVQYGADQPEYDVVAVRGKRVLKVSVKGSRDVGWGLTQSYLSNADYHRAADAWLERHSSGTVLCFVHFRCIPVHELPRMYLASPGKVADWLKKAHGGRGYTILYGPRESSRRPNARSGVDIIPDGWMLTRGRLDKLASMPSA